MQVFGDVDQWWLFLLGVAVVLLTLFDVVWTVIAAAIGRGPLSRLITEGVWRLLTIGGAGRRRRQLAGYAVVVALPCVWVLLLVTGFSLLYFAGDAPIVDANQPGSVTPQSVVAYAMGGLAGAGAGYTASTGLWEFINNFSALTGLALFTLGVTFLLRVVSADANGRAAASGVGGLGKTPYDIVDRALTESDLSTLTMQVMSLSSSISQVGQDHLTLPILRYLNPADPEASIKRSVVVFDEVLTLLEVSVADTSPLLIAIGRSAVDDFMRTLPLPPSHDTPPPELAVRAVQHDMEVFVTDDVLPEQLRDLEDRRLSMGSRLRDLEERRLALGSLLRHGGWTWDDIYTPP